MDDHAAIVELLERQFQALSWNKDQEGDWAGFSRDFVDKAQLFASARPARSQTVKEFVERMQGLSKGSLPDLQEKLLGHRIEVFGNVAVATAVCELTENQSKVTYNIEALLLLKENGQWRIASQAWDTATDAAAAKALWVEDAKSPSS